MHEAKASAKGTVSAGTDSTHAAIAASRDSLGPARKSPVAQLVVRLAVTRAARMTSVLLITESPGAGT
jgi:hypothetical protein